MSKLMHRLNAIHFEVRSSFFAVDKMNLILVWKFKGPGIGKTVLKRKKEVGRLTLI